MSRRRRGSPGARGRRVAARLMPDTESATGADDGPSSSASHRARPDDDDDDDNDNDGTSGSHEAPAATRGGRVYGWFQPVDVSGVDRLQPSLGLCGSRKMRIRRVVWESALLEQCVTFCLLRGVDADGDGEWRAWLELCRNFLDDSLNAVFSETRFRHIATWAGALKMVRETDDFAALAARCNWDKASPFPKQHRKPVGDVVSATMQHVLAHLEEGAQRGGGDGVWGPVLLEFPFTTDRETLGSVVEWMRSVFPGPADENMERVLATRIFLPPF